MIKHTDDERLYLDRLRLAVGMDTARPSTAHTIAEHGPDSYEALARTQWSPEFEYYMRNRLIMGGLRYGRFYKPGKPKYDRAKSIIKRARLYQQTGNQDHLFDIANEALCEFKEPSHSKAHFVAQDDGYHTEVAE